MIGTHSGPRRRVKGWQRAHVYKSIRLFTKRARLECSSVGSPTTYRVSGERDEVGKVDHCACSVSDWLSVMVVVHRKMIRTGYTLRC